MSTLLNYLKLPNNKSLLWWMKFYWNYFLTSLYEQKVSNKTDNSWKNIKLLHSIYPDNMPKEFIVEYDYNARFNSKNEINGLFQYLGKEFQGTMMKKFKD